MPKISPRLILAAAGLSVLMLALPGGGPLRAQETPVVTPGPTEEVTVVTGSGVYPFRVEIADTPGERAQGLMYRRSLPADGGMLFLMGSTARANFWMHETYVSLDIIFIRPDGIVDSIAAEARPLSDALVSSDGPVAFVLELPAGTAARIGLEPGDRVRHPAIPGA